MLSKAIVQLTYVQYDPDWWISKPLAYITLTPLVIIVALAGVIAARREIESLALAAGLLCNEILNQVLKRAIRQPRPFGSGQTNYGMPSSHTQFCFFFAVYFMLWMRTRVSFAPPQGIWLKRLLTGWVFVCAVIISFSRVWLLEHSVAQVLVGAAVGTLFGYSWHIFLHYRLRPLYSRFEQTAIARYFYLKDSMLHSNVLLWEYENHLAARAKLVVKIQS